MEEADEFIREACRHLDCSFSHDDEIEFSTPQIFEFLVRCIWKVDSGSKAEIPSYHVKNIAGRLHLGNKISEYLQKFHIRGDIALSTVLYGNINNLRSAFIELIRKLPADAQDKVDEDQSCTFFAKTLEILVSEPEWVPVYCRGLQETEHHWVPLDNSPELFSLCTARHSIPTDPRSWIAQYTTSTHLAKRPEEVPYRKSGRPALPPKPAALKKKGAPEQEQDEESTPAPSNLTDETAMLEEKYKLKMVEYEHLQAQRVDFEKKSNTLRKKLSEHDLELIEALQNPEFYAQNFLDKIAELNKQMEDDVAGMEQRKKEAAQREKTMSDEMKAISIRDEEMRQIAEREVALENIVEKIEANKVLAEKLRKKLAKASDDNFYEYEKRSKELDEMVRKQENDMIKMQEERMVLRKQEERESEAVNRSFAIIYNILLQHCDQYRGRLAMESFTRIHLYCMEIMEMLRENGSLKQAVACLQTEIGVEEQKQYDKQLEMMKKDYDEIAYLNEELYLQIKARNPDFQLPKL